MVTIVDAMILELQLDPRKFDAAHKDAAKKLLDDRDRARKAAGEVERHVSDIGSLMVGLQGRIMSLFAAFTAGKGIKEFVADVTATGAETARLAQTLDTTEETLSAWRGAARIAGGSAEGMTGAIQGLVSQFNTFALTGESSVIPYLRALETLAPGTLEAFSKGDWSSTLLKISEAFQKLDPARAAAFGHAFGFDQGTISFLLRGPQAVQALLDEQKRLGVVTKEDAAAAQALQSSMRELEQSSTTLGRTLLTTTAPSLVAVLKSLTELAVWAQTKPALVEKAFAVMATAVGAFAIALAPVSVTVSAIAASIAAIIAFSESEEEKQKRAEERQKRQSQFGTPGNTIGARRRQQGLSAGLSSRQATDATWQYRDIDSLVRMGWTREQAAGIVANIQAESSGNVADVGDAGQAYGLAQWHPDRQREFARWAGHDIRQATREEQLGFIDYELRHGTEQRAGKALMRAGSAAEAGAVVSRLYERPAAVEEAAQSRAAIAAALDTRASRLGTIGGAPAAASAGGAVDNSRSTTTSHETNIGAIHVNAPHATDASGIAAELPAAIDRTGLAAQANYGLM